MEIDDKKDVSKSDVRPMSIEEIMKYGTIVSPDDGLKSKKYGDVQLEDLQKVKKEMEDRSWNIVIAAGIGFIAIVVAVAVEVILFHTKNNDWQYIDKLTNIQTAQSLKDTELNNINARITDSEKIQNFMVKNHRIPTEQEINNIIK